MFTFCVSCTKWYTYNFVYVNSLDLLMALTEKNMLTVCVKRKEMFPITVGQRRYTVQFSSVFF